MSEERRRQLEHGLLLFEPSRLVARLRNVRDIFEHRHVLKQAAYSAQLVEHLARLISDGLASGERFRVFDSLKVLRAVVRSGGERQLPVRAVRRLVAIYQQLILNSREEVQWCLSRLLKGQMLDDFGSLNIGRIQCTSLTGCCAIPRYIHELSNGRGRVTMHVISPSDTRN